MVDPIGTELAEAAVGKAATSLQGRIARAAIRLIAGGPGFKYFDEIRRNENTIEGRKKVDLIVAEEVARQAIADPDFMERAKARFLGDLAAKQENLEAVAREANSHILELTEDEILEEDEAEPSDDWMNAFAREAEIASSEELRSRLAKVLAGETRKPGTFSRSTIRTIAEIEKNTLELFQQILPLRLGNIIPKCDDWKSGEPLHRELILRSDGLISGGEFTSVNQTMSSQGVSYLMGETAALVFEGEAQAKVNFPAYIVTRTGIEIASLLNVPLNPGALQPVIDKMNKANLSRVFVGPKVKMGAGFQIMPTFVLWQKEEA